MHYKTIELPSRDELPITADLYAVHKPKAFCCSVIDHTRRMDRKYVSQFTPYTGGFHGSRTLWEEVEGSEDCRQAPGAFLARLD
ncbi:MAG: hypothetical protein K1X75_13260 [Leptospirales bacterium]|nr:hypothetical protein [Leptospirales bacterium]